ncbi:MAG: tRNA pseudouridine(38-40) synthase TruA [Verrucomicrobia bacterium]|nr:tRNA pseudouridine(38-40) synthase TruA [Verrucomicrobiota bacterium]
MNIQLIISYQGTPFLGWQKTKEGPSIEAALEEALQTLLRHPVTLQAASRTDAGVHAEGQVVNFFTRESITPRRLLHSLNGILPREIAVLHAEEMPPAFHPTLDAKEKQYGYLICHGPVQLPLYRHTSWHFPRALDVGAMESASKALIGTHDFSAFCNALKEWDRTTICTLTSIAITPLPDERLSIQIQGDHFLYKMMRNLVGTLAYIGCGKLSPGAILDLLAGKDRTCIGMTAPAHGLVLKKVFYHDAQ